MSIGTGEDLELPTTLGRYQLLAKIASGGAATVYLARMVGKAGFARTVAVKVLHRHLASDPEFVAMFLDEARLSARISHPNVVDVYDVDALSGRLLIVMEYVEGVSLDWLSRKHRKQGGKIPVELALRVVHDALLGIHAAHELRDERDVPLGLIHRDFSPQNLLVGTDGITRVTDFGIAKARGRMATTLGKDVVKGKLCYLAPEQFMQEDVDRRTDLFAAGIILWEVLAGKHLFVRGTDQATIAAIVNADIPPPSMLRRDVPKAVDAVCDKALQREVVRRYTTAAEMAEALEEAAGKSFLSTREAGKLVAQFASERLDKARRAMTEAAERASINTPMDSGTGDLPRKIAASLVDPGEVAPALSSETPVTGATLVPDGTSRRRRALTIGVATVVLAAAVGWVAVALFPAGPESGAATPSPTATDTSPPSQTGAPPTSASASAAETAAAATDAGSPDTDASAASTNQPEAGPPPRKGGARPKDGLYWPSQL